MKISISVLGLVFLCNTCDNEVKVMEEIINKIIEQNKNLFNDNFKIGKINVGFTNTIYSINDKYIIKICSKIDNEEKFKKEIDFYNVNKGNKLIPRMYYASTDKTEIPYYYEILEKIEGVTVYDIWHTLNERQREEIIKQLCDAMQQFHSNKGNVDNWIESNKSLFASYFNKAKEMNLLTDDEIELLDKASLKFDELFKTDEYVLVHNDLHFDNVFYNDGEIKLIDFERSMYAPREYELGILYRMVRFPWKFASEENEKYTKINDYENIMYYIENYYPELIHIDNLYKKLAAYDMIYYLRPYVNNPEYIENKEDTLNAAKIVLGK